MKKIRVLTAIKPTGQLTLGHYIGILKNLKEMQTKNYECFIFIANLHALTQPIEPKVLYQSSIDIALLYLASGLDPQKNVIFLQSDVPAHTELNVIIQNFFYIGELKRMTQFKTQFQKNLNTSLGLFMYPVLMAADIILYDTNIVPVGEDQIQHIELTRNFVHRFNNIFKKKAFVMPNFVVNKVGKRIMNLFDPTKKMSKSSPKGVIFLKDEPDVIFNKIMKSVTDSENVIKYDVNKKPGISNLLSIYASLKDCSIQVCEKHFKNYSYADFKKEVAKLVIQKISMLQKKYNHILKSNIVHQVLKEGAKKANQMANKKLKKIKTIVGLNIC